jgi:hypothetical protein
MIILYLANAAALKGELFNRYFPALLYCNLCSDHVQVGVLGDHEILNIVE